MAPENSLFSLGEVPGPGGLLWGPWRLEAQGPSPQSSTFGTVRFDLLRPSFLSKLPLENREEPQAPESQGCGGFPWPCKDSASFRPLSIVGASLGGFHFELCSGRSERQLGDAK